MCRYVCMVAMIKLLCLLFFETGMDYYTILEHMSFFLVLKKKNSKKNVYFFSKTAKNYIFIFSINFRFNFVKVTEITRLNVLW